MSLRLQSVSYGLEELGGGGLLFLVGGLEAMELPVSGLEGVEGVVRPFETPESGVEWAVVEGGSVEHSKVEGGLSPADRKSTRLNSSH